MVKVKKVFGELEGKVWIEGELVSFDAEGNAEVSEEVAQYLKDNQFPDYEVEASEDEIEDEIEAGEEPTSEVSKKPAPRKAPPKPKAN